MVCCLLIELRYKSQHKFFHLNSCIVGELFCSPSFYTLNWVNSSIIYLVQVQYYSVTIVHNNYCVLIRKAILPIEAELGNVGESEGSASESESDEELDSYKED